MNPCVCGYRIVLVEYIICQFDIMNQLPLVGDLT